MMKAVFNALDIRSFINTSSAFKHLSIIKRR